MRYAAGALIGLFGLILGWIAAAFGTLALGKSFGLSDFEGERAMVAFFAVGPLGGLIGLLLGIWMWRRPRTRG